MRIQFELDLNILDCSNEDGVEWTNRGMVWIGNQRVTADFTEIRSMEEFARRVVLAKTVGCAWETGESLADLED